MGTGVMGYSCSVVFSHQLHMRAFYQWQRLVLTHVEGARSIVQQIVLQLGKIFLRSREWYSCGGGGGGGGGRRRRVAWAVTHYICRLLCANGCHFTDGWEGRTYHAKSMHSDWDDVLRDFQIFRMTSRPHKQVWHPVSAIALVLYEAG